MEETTCVGCPYRYKTSPGCCQGCQGLRPQAVAAMAPAKSQLEQFLQAHPGQGTLRIQAFRGNQVLPVEGAKVTVSRLFDGKEKIFFQGETDGSGIIEGIVLPGQNQRETLNPETAASTAVYRVRAIHPGYEPVETLVDIFAQEKTILPISFYLAEVE